MSSIGSSPQRTHAGDAIEHNIDKHKTGKVIAAQVL